LRDEGHAQKEPIRQFASHKHSPQLQQARFAMRVSLAVGVLMLVGKATAY